MRSKQDRYILKSDPGLANGSESNPERWTDIPVKVDSRGDRRNDTAQDQCQQDSKNRIPRDLYQGSASLFYDMKQRLFILFSSCSFASYSGNQHTDLIFAVFWHPEYRSLSAAQYHDKVGQLHQTSDPHLRKSRQRPFFFCSLIRSYIVYEELISSPRTT